MPYNTPITPEIDSKYIKDSEPISNMLSVHMRDDAGNIILMDSDSTKNNIIVIEPIRKYYTVDNVLRILDTNFEYYSFPVVTIDNSAEDIPDFDISADVEKELADLAEAQERDLITKRFKIIPGIDENKQTNPLLRVGTVSESTWFYGNDKKSSGYTRIPFVGPEQEQPGTYLITEDMVTKLRAKKKVISFYIYVHFDTDSAVSANDYTYYVRLNRREKFKRGNMAGGALKPVVVRESEWNKSPVLALKYIIDPEDLYANDMYYIEAQTKYNSYLKVDECYWDIDMIDDPAYSRDRSSVLWGSPRPGVTYYGVEGFGFDEGTKLQDATGTTHFRLNEYGNVTNYKNVLQSEREDILNLEKTIVSDIKTKLTNYSKTLLDNIKTGTNGYLNLVNAMPFYEFNPSGGGFPSKLLRAELIKLGDLYLNANTPEKRVALIQSFATYKDVQASNKLVAKHWGGIGVAHYNLIVKAVEDAIENSAYKGKFGAVESRELYNSTIPTIIRDAFKNAYDIFENELNIIDTYIVDVVQPGAAKTADAKLKEWLAVTYPNGYSDKQTSIVLQYRTAQFKAAINAYGFKY